MSWRIYGEKIYYLRNHVHDLTREELVEKVNLQISNASYFLKEKTLQRWEGNTPQKFNNNSQKAFSALAKALDVTTENLILRNTLVPDANILHFYNQNKGTKRPRKFFVESNSESKTRLAIFDFDGTLFTNYTFSWKEIWRYLGYPDSIRTRIYQQYRAGEITYDEWCQICVTHFKKRNLNRNQFEEICRQIKPVRNLFEGLEVLKESDIKLAIVSGGVDTFLFELIPDYKKYFEHVYMNRLLFDSSNALEGVIPTSYDFIGKKSASLKLCKLYGLPPEAASFTGDQINDESLWTTSLKTIAFNAPEGGMRDSFQYAVDSGDFLDVVKVILEDK